MIINKKALFTAGLLAVVTGAIGALAGSSGTADGKEPAAKLVPLAVSFQDAAAERSLLGGPPQTMGYISGFVILAKGEDMHEHTAGSYEEVIVVLSGKGEARFQGFPSIGFQEGTLLYIPPNTRHSVANTGGGPLKYIYLVAPAAGVK